MQSLSARTLSRIRRPLSYRSSPFRGLSNHVRCISSIPNSISISPPQNDTEQTSNRQKRNPEPWINPNSLRDTLDKHREANRSRQAIDGTSIEEVHRIRRKENLQDGLPHNTQLAKLHPASRRLVFPASSVTRSGKEYAGESRGLSWDWKMSTTLPRGLRMPWVYHLERSNTTRHDVPGLQRLNDEISACKDYLLPTTVEIQAAQTAYTEICKIILSAFGTEEITCELIGSRATGLASPLSDLDINLKTPQWRTFDEQQRLAALKQLHKALRYPSLSVARAKDISVRMFLQKTAVPIIECVHIPSTLTFQVQFSQSGYESLELAKAFVAEYPTLLSLYLIAKQMLVMRGLTIGRHGGITSYPLLNMIVASLKFGNAAKDRSALGAQLLEFLDFFSEIDFHSTAIRYYSSGGSSDELGLDLEHVTAEDENLAVDPVTAQPLLRAIKSKGKLGDVLMSLQDPADMANDLGKSTYLIKHIQETFIEARQQIRRAMAIWNQKHKRGLDMTTHGEPLLAWCLEGDYSQLEGSRQTLRKYEAEPQP